MFLMAYCSFFYPKECGTVDLTKRTGLKWWPLKRPGWRIPFFDGKLATIGGLDQQDIYMRFIREQCIYVYISYIYIYTFYVLLSKYRTYVNILYDIWMLYLHNSLIHPLSAGEISPFPLQLGSRMRRKRRAGSWSMAMSSGNPGGSTDNVQIAEDRAPM